MTGACLRFEIDFGDSRVSAGVCSDATLFDKEILLPVQTHSCNVAVADSICSLQDTDAVITRTPGLCIGVRTADCVPMLLYAPDIAAAATIHAGWKGSLGGIADRTLELLSGLGADSQLLQVAFGPSICGNCYEVSRELADEFRTTGFSDCIIGERNVDLEAVNTRRLLKAGVRPENIRPKSCCTLETPAFPSWRRNSDSRRLLSWIMLSL